MNAPTKPGRVAPGINVKITELEPVQTAVDDYEPTAFQARVTVGKLLVGKATVLCQSCTSASDDDYRAEAEGYAWAQATRRIEKWRRGVAAWDEMMSE